MPATVCRITTVLFAASGAAIAQIPPGYYATVDTSSPTALRRTLHAVIDDHVRFEYTASSTDTWDILERAQEDPADARRIVDVYKNGSFRKGSDRVTGFNREHTWPKSYGFPINDPDNYPYTDCHQLFLCDVQYNADRSNMPFAQCSATCSERPTVRTNGTGGGTGSYPGNSNWLTGQFTSGSWEVWRGRRGDVARALLYLDVRYEGGRHGTTGSAEPDLVLTEDRALISQSQTGGNRSVGYMGLLSVLLQWHRDDPVDGDEQRRNDVVFAYQRNRNPFVDRPEWVGLLFGGPVPGSFTSYGRGCSGSQGTVPQIGVSTEPLIGRSLIVTVTGASANRSAILNLDINRQQLDLGFLGFPGCTALAFAVFDLPTQTNGLGAAGVTLPIPNQTALVAQSLHGQWLVVEAPGIAASDGGTLTFGRP